MCQQVFEAEDDLDVTGLDEEQTEKKRNTHRDRTLGNVRFIGELYKVNILGQTTLLNCAWDLIDQRLARAKIRVEDLELNEDRLEGVNILLTTVRDKLSTSARVQETMNQMYEELRLIVDRRTDLSTKIRYRLLNLIEEKDQMGT
jgi:hypothetical protein